MKRIISYQLYLPSKLRLFFSVKAAPFNHSFAFSGHLIPVLILSFFFIATFPGDYRSVTPGLDPSWVFAINYISSSSEFSFGQDVIFTYGPLGYLAHPLNIGNNLIQAEAVRIITHLILFLSLYYVTRQKRISALRLLLFLCVWFVFCTHLGFDFYLNLIACLLIAFSFRYRMYSLVFYALACVFSAISLFVKFNSGISSLMLIISTAIAISYFNESWRQLSPGLISYLAATIGIAVYTIGSPANIWKWVVGSLEIANGYVSAMSLSGHREALILCIFLFFVWGSLLTWLLLLRSQIFVLGLIFSVALFVSFKSGFVRQDGHVLGLFFFVLPLTSILLITSDSKKASLSVAFALIIFLFLLTRVINLAISPPSLWQTASNIFLLKTGPQQVVNLFSINSVKERLNEESARNLSSRKLSRLIEKHVNKTVDTVNAFPIDISYIPANNMRWRPLPTLQAYSAYTSYLDHLNADHYASSRKPDILLINFDTIDGRHLMLDTPATWRSILDHYEIVNRIGAPLLLKKKLFPPASLSMIPVSSESITTDQWITVPDSNSLLFVSSELSLTLWGKAVKTLYKIPEVEFECVYENGRTVSYRIPPDVLTNGLLINYLPRNLIEVADLFKCHRQNRVVKFRITGPGLKYFHHTVPLTWHKWTPANCSAYDLSAPSVIAKPVQADTDLLSLLPETFEESPPLRIVPTGLFMHADGQMELGPFQTTQELSFKVNLRLDPSTPADQGADGVDFTISILSEGTVLSRQQVTLPPDAQKIVSITKQLPVKSAFSIKLETSQRGTSIYDWAVWENPRFELR